MGRRTGKRNIKFAQEKTAYLRKNDEKYRNNEIENARKMGRKYGPINMQKFWDEHHEEALENALNALKIINNNPEIQRLAVINSQKARIQKLKKLFEENPIRFDYQYISFEDLQQLRKNDICGSWIIRAKFKAYKGTNRENEVFCLSPFKSIKVYDEMYWVFRVISQPNKQNRWITNENHWNLAKWWYIVNLYYDFEFELITDEKGVSEEEALVAEAAYASKYDLFVKFTEDEEGRRIPVVEKHAYWSP